MLSLCLHFQEFQPIYFYKGCAYKKEGSFKVEIDSEDLRTSIRVQDELKNTFLTHSSLISNW